MKIKGTAHLHASLKFGLKFCEGIHFDIDIWQVKLVSYRWEMSLQHTITLALINKFFKSILVHDGRRERSSW